MICCHELFWASTVAEAVAVVESSIAHADHWVAPVAVATFAAA